jgi:hypothetical protein
VDDEVDAETAGMIRRFLAGNGSQAIFDPVRPHWEALLAAAEGRAGDMTPDELQEHRDAIERFSDETLGSLDQLNDVLDAAIAEGRRELFGGTDEPKGPPN